ncbi:MAG TPA: class I SAM-dependent methyltransferase [Mycobacteriales bacterium]|jgi:ubiquinone/menaquinone biosynthesis C-methylase UbiE|nr:class I SAM-dependent methyltransferase [Mycobacteriales bacterium]
MIYQHPLAYLLGLEGIALLRAWAGDFDEDFVQARLAETRRLLDDESLANHDGVLVNRGDTMTGYRQFSTTYDTAANGLFQYDEPIVREILDAQPKGIALDAACGTGRYTAHLAALGHRVIGVDRSPDMLARARKRVPTGAFLIGDLHRMPLPEDAVDIVVCGLALAHLPALEPVMTEFARVLRPGGHLIISDAHHERILQGSVVKALGPAGEPGVSPTYRHTTGDYLRAALAVRLQVRRCEEPRPSAIDPPAPPTGELTPGDWAQWPWSLRDLVPEATAAASVPLTIIWHFQLAES